MQMYPQMQLGGEKEMIEQAQVGALQIARISVGAMGRSSTSSTCSTCRSVPRRGAHAQGHRRPDRQRAPREGHRTRARADRAGLDGRGTRNVYSNKPVTKPADLKGMKVRMMGNPIFVETMNAMGGTASRWASTSSTAALQTGVVDGAENNRRPCSRRTITR
jgi:TRAP-type C4-dicarboxylate transport system substrate-binding protein